MFLNKPALKTNALFLTFFAANTTFSVYASIKEVNKKRKPNILYIMMDQLKYDALGCNGNKIIKTPHIDKLGAQGIRFTNAFTSSPVCMPSRQSTLTGRYPHATGVTFNGDPLPDEENTIAEILNTHGYKSIAIGKMHFIRNDTTHGFEYLNIGALNSPHGEYKEYLEKNKIDYAKLHYYTDPDNQFFKQRIMTGTSHIPEKHFISSYIADRAIEKLEENKDAPFLMWVSFWGPHPLIFPPHPWATMYKPSEITLPKWIKNEFKNKPKHQQNFFEAHYPEAYGFPLLEGQKKYTYKDSTEEDFQIAIARYYGFISFIDSQIGKILKRVDDLNLSDNTIVIFTSDHGDFMGEHKFAQKCLAMAYDAITKVPLIIRYPKTIKPNQVTNELVSNVDYLPTFLDLLNIKEPGTIGVHAFSFRFFPLIQGKSFAGLLKNDTFYTPREHIFIEGGWAGMNERRFKALRTKKWKYVFHLNDIDELYNLKSDPGELYNLANKKRNAKLISSFRATIVDWMLRTELRPNRCNPKIKQYSCEGLP